MMVPTVISKTRQICLFLVISQWLSGYCSGIRQFRPIEVLNPHPRLEQPDPDDDNVQEAYLEQQLDHFRDDKRTFSQRYFISERFVRSNATRHLAFLCVGGEGPSLTKSVLVDSLHCSGDMLLSADLIFQEFEYVSVHLFALEHRYYGESYPSFESSSPVTNENLVYLSSRQALADLAHFCANLTAVVDKPLEWVTFGGSYPGMLAAFARLKYPHLVSAAVSNSAPIQPVVNFYQYNQHVGRALSETDIGGSQACLDVVTEGHAQAVELVSDPARHEEVAEALNVCNVDSLKDPKSLYMLLGDGLYDFHTQGNDPNCTEPRCNIGSSCQALLDYHQNHTAWETLTWGARLQNQNCLTLDWQRTLDYIKDPVRGKEGGLRSWLWQTCTEFGFYQTCETNSSCPFGRGYHPLSEDLEVCDFAFDVSADEVYEAVEASIEEYGGWDLTATRIYSVTGTVDPWTELALTTSCSDDLPVMTVEGDSHHFWTHDVKPLSDSFYTMMARLFILNKVKEWLGLKDDETETATSIS